MAASTGLKLYKSYSFKDKDPIIDKMRTVLSDEGVKESEACELSGLSQSTLRNWFHGETRRPQFATVMALARSVGYDLELVKSERRVTGSKGVTLRRNIRAKANLNSNPPPP